MGYVHFEEMFGERNSVLRKGPVSIVAIDSSEPDLDHGQIGRGRYRWIEEQFATEPADLRIFVLHHHLLPVPGTGRERNVVYDAGDAIECLQRAGVRLVLSGHKHVPYVWRLEDLFVVNAGTVSSPRQHETLLQRHRDRGAEGGRVAATSVPRPGAARFLLAGHARVREVHRRDRGRGHGPHVRAVAIVDGEHYAAVVRHALAELPYEFAAAVLIGGEEKLRGGEDYGVPLVADVESAIAAHRPAVVVDLSDEPVLGPHERLALVSRVLARGVPYVGADFRFDPPERVPFTEPSIAVVGTGKRVGKTAVTGHLARLLAADRNVVVVAMGRGGPPEPEIVTIPPTVESLVELSRSGRHAASDHLETAALTGVATVGSWRCGGGLAGAVSTSNVADGARVAAGLAPEVVVFDGSGAALPPVAADRTVVVVGGHQDPRVASGYLNAYRLLLADIVVVTMAEAGTGWEEVAAGVRSVVREDLPVVGTVLRPRPLADVRGRTVAYFCAAPSEAHERIRAHLEDTYGAVLVHVSGNLSNRPALRDELAEVSADVYLVELKAAAIDVVAEAALARGAAVVLAANDVVSVSPERELDELLLGMAKFRT